jgi:hypothetical protein
MRKLTTILVLYLVAVLQCNAQSKLDSLAIAPDRWRLALVRLSIESDTLQCPTTQSRLYRSGRYGDRVVYEAKGKVFKFKESEILYWCARKEGL